MSNKKTSKKDLFLELAKPDNKGFSRKVSVDEFVGRYESLRMGNGGDWCRKDGSLGKKFNIERIPAEKGNKIVAIMLHGFNTKEVIDKTIPTKIREKFEGQRCRVLNISNAEIDHKDGRRDDPRPPNELTADDFQPLSKAVNNAKRQVCKECRRTNKRFDARLLGYAVEVVHGGGEYRGTCVGCYWYDPYYFNQQISKKDS